MITLATHYDLAVVQFDVKTAFLYGEIDEEVYIQPPQGVCIGSQQALKLQKGLYGLKQAPRLWNNKFKQVVESQGFRPTQSDPCLFRHTEKKIFMVIYVDDGLLLARTGDELKVVLDLLRSHFDIRVVTDSTFVGSEIERTGDGYFVHQKSYTLSIPRMMSI